MLQALADNYCKPFDANAALAQAYAGGLPALQRDFYAWLADPAEKRLHVY